MSLTLRTAVPALLLASSAGVVLAQQPAAEKASAPSAAASAPKGVAAAAATAASAAPAGASSYRSAFEGYRPLTDQPVLPWRESNDVVGRIGGWQSYAREGQGGAPADAAATPSPAASQGKSGMPAMPGMPAGHEGMKMPSTGSGTPAAMPAMGSNANPPKSPMKMPASRPDSANSAAPPKATTAPAAASAAMPGGHTGHKQP